MPKFGKKSLEQLETCNRDIQTIFSEVIKYFDCSVIEGKRTAERQHEHWQKGRKFLGGDPKKRSSWVTTGSVVTRKDGYEQLSKHQLEDYEGKSIAVDVVPYPSRWGDMVELHKLAGVVYYIQDKLYDEGKIRIKLDRGFDIWNGFDAPHWQIRKEYL